MRRELLATASGVALVAALASPSARADDAGRPASPAATASPPRASATTDSGAARKPGATETDGALPGGHPSTGPQAGGSDDGTGGATDPHAGGGANGPMNGDPPEDTVLEDPSLPKGTVEVRLVDPAGKPLQKAEVTLGIVYNSVAKGESRKRLQGTTDELGVARFRDLDAGSGVAYRPMALRDGATFSATPFPLGQRGMRALLHVYPVTSDVTQVMIVSQSMIYAEVKDDRVQIQQSFQVYNLGRTAWLPGPETLVALPEGFTAFAAQQGMTDVGVDLVPNKGVRLRGTISPGQHVVEFKWQLPYSGEAEITFDVGAPPNLRAARVVAPAAKGMGMDVAGFPPTKSTTDGMGQRALVTEKQQVRREDPPMPSVTVTIKGLPTEGPGKIIASLLALSGLVAGLVLGSRKPPPRDTKREREQLLAALASLEQGHRDGTIGPKTYERARRELVDDVARTFAAEPKVGPAPKRKRPAPTRA